MIARTLRLLLIPALLAAGAAGCGGAGASPAGPAAHSVGPHGGITVALPADAGFGEVVMERPRAAAKAKPKAGSASVVVYFLGPDLKAALSPTPTDVRVTLNPPDGSAPVALTLKPEPQGDDPADVARFASPAGAFDFDELRGELTATLGGRPFTAPFAFQ